jgi:pSer/pThr/pTyr-binding forkhead associated (FHA) protein
MDYQLVVIRGRSAATAVKLQDGVTTAGRQEECQLRIKSSQVSRKHCELFEKHGMLLVKDLGSSNGTFVNGKKINGQRVMEPGDELGIGPIVFRVEKIGQPAPPRPAAPAASKSSDTAIAEGIGVAEAVPDEEFEIDFDDEPVTAVAEATGDLDFEIELDEVLSAPMPAPTPEPVAAPAPAPEPAPEKKSGPGLAASTKAAPPKAKEPGPPPPKEDAGVADEAVADFLLGIKVSDDD